ncbi:MAG TPA: FtsX-like permease family protein [Casimicrobiaceae bacterium]|nr:FtsX-like permease family protein [Casimicrobiaceae bacterium]
MPFDRLSSLQFVLAARNLVRHRTRTLISLSAIAFGVAALLIAGGFVEWIFWAMRHSTINAGLGHIHITRPGFIQDGSARPHQFLMAPDAATVSAVRKLPGVTAVDQRLNVSGLASHGNVTVGFTGEAVDPEPYRATSSDLSVAGENLDAARPSDVLLGRGLAQTLKVRRGDMVTLLVSLPRGGINAVEARVGGTFATAVRAFDDSAVRMPLELGRQLLRVDGAHRLVVKLKETEATDGALAALKAVLPSERFALTSWLEQSDFYRKAVVLLSRQIEVMAIVIGAIIVLGITNTLTMNVLERTGEIGTMMAMGTSRSRVLQLFLAEGALLGVTGASVGLVIASLLAQALSYFGIPMPPPPGRDTGYSAEILLTPKLAAWGAATAFLSTVIASLYPAWRASRLTIVDALRHNR